MRVLHPRAWAVLPPLVASWAALSSAISIYGLVFWVALGSTLVWGVMGAQLTVGRRVAAAATGIVLTLSIAVGANILGGNVSGPLARAAFLTCGLAAAATALAFTRWPVLLLVPLLALLGSAVALGASYSATVWVGAWAVAAVTSLAVLGPYGTRGFGDRRRVVPLAVILAAAGLVAVVVSALAGALLTTAWTIPGVPVAAPQTSTTLTPTSSPTATTNSPSPTLSPTSTQSSPTPSPTLSPMATSTRTPTPTPTSTRTVPVEQSSVQSALASLLPWLLLVLLLFLLLVLLWLAWQMGRRLVARLRWRRLRRRLSTGDPAAVVVGAWTWVRLLAARYDRPLPPWAAPDVAIRWAREQGDADLARLAEATASVAFNPSATATAQDAALAWDLAAGLERTLGRGTSRQRWRWSAVPPPPLGTVRSRPPRVQSGRHARRR